MFIDKVLKHGDRFRWTRQNFEGGAHDRPLNWRRPTEDSNYSYSQITNALGYSVPKFIDRYCPIVNGEDGRYAKAMFCILMCLNKNLLNEMSEILVDLDI